MQFSRTIAARLLPKRLDPDYYAPQHLADEEQFDRIGSILLGDTGKLFAGPFGSLLPTIAFVDNGIPLFRVGNVAEMEVNYEDLAKIPESLHQEIKASEITAGDLLIVKASVGEKICVVPSDIPKGNVTQHIIGLHPNGRCDMYFVAAALFGSYGRRQLQRRALGAIIQYLGVQEARTVLLPKLGSDAQAYIGNKVRQAETLRSRAKTTEGQFRAAISEEISRPDKRAKFSRVTAGMLVGDLNPGRFDPDRLEVRNRLFANGGRRLSDFARIVTNNIDDYPRDQRYLGLDGISTSSIDITFETAAEADANGTSRKLLEGAVLSKLRPYLNKVGYISSEDAGAIGSTELLCVQSDEVHGGYIYGVLKLETTTRQLNPISTGATLPRIGSADVLDVVVPWSDDHEVWGQRLAAAQLSYKSAKRLTTAARFLVEALIEQKVTEADLIAAHKDPERDRELLARLTTKGLDVADAPPLFPDLDALNELLNASDEGEVGV